MNLPNLILREFAARQAKNQRYSLRAMAKSLGVSSSALSEIVRLKRRVSPKLTSRLADRLCLSPAEKDKLLRATFELQMSAEATADYQVLDEDRYQVISGWQHYAILSLVEDAAFNCTPETVARRLNISKRVATMSINRLVRSELLVKDIENRLVWTGKNISSSDDLASASIRKSHRESLDMAHVSLERDAVSEREFSAITMLIDPEKLPIAKSIVREFRDRLAATLETGRRQRVYRLAVQLFPLSDFSPVKRQKKS